MNERYQLDIYRAGEVPSDSMQSGEKLEMAAQPSAHILSEQEEIEWDLLLPDPLKSAEGDIGHERNASTQERGIIDIDIVVEEPTDTQAGAQSAENDRQEISRLRRELDRAADSDAETETGIVPVSIEHDYVNTPDSTDARDIPKTDVDKATLEASGPEPTQIIDVESNVEPMRGPGRLAKARVAIGEGLRKLAKRILPTPMTPESAQATIDRAQQVEGEYTFWVSEANKVSSRITEIESQLRMHPDLKRHYNEELRSLRGKQEEIRRGQARRQKILFPLRDKAILAKRMVDSVSSRSARREEVRQGEKQANEYAERLHSEMFLATDWVNAWNKKFGAVFSLNLDSMVEEENKKGGNVNISHLNGIDFEQVLWEEYQKRSTTSVKINRAQFKNMVGQAFIDLLGTSK